jgi:predicted phosphodiesterase
VVSAVAVLSDVHGVLPVLDAVLAEPDLAAADLIVVTGDHASGPQPVEVLDRLVGLGDRGILVRGNADRELVDIARGGTSDHPESMWAAGQLRADQLRLLDELPHPVVLDVDGFGPVVFCHEPLETTRRWCWLILAWKSGPRSSPTCHLRFRQ